jgi:hypothetical protein
MSVNTAIINWEQTSPTGGGNLAILTVSPLTKLLRVEARGAITYPATTFTDTAVGFANPVMVGIQAIPHGNTPLALPANITAADWLTVEQRTAGEASIAWAPDTDTAAGFAGGGYSIDWAGQKYFSANTDLVFTDGQSTGYSLTWMNFGTMRIWYV